MSRWMCVPMLGMALTLALAGCGDKLPTAPTAPTPVLVTEVLSGTIGRNDAETTPFAADRAGAIEATLTTLAGPTNIGLALGTWNGQVCAIVLANDKAPMGTKIQGTAAGPGGYCLRVYDIGEITDGSPAAYTVTVTHY